MSHVDNPEPTPEPSVMDSMGGGVLGAQGQAQRAGTGNQTFTPTQKWLTGEPDVRTVTIHRTTELIPGGKGARIGYSDDFPDKQFLLITEPRRSHDG